ncbi:MAG: TetR family transcriptional regulator [Myxococcales bacterium]|nr:TetR family transcriptional regulator [Myxococcales bacterium]
MARTGLSKKEQSERTRAAIVDAAIKLFARKGYASTSMQDLAGAIRMTTGSLYWHFEDKEALLAGVLGELEARLAVELAQKAEGFTHADSATTLRALIHHVARIVDRHQELMLLVGVIGAEVTDTNPKVERVLRAAYGRVAEFVRALLRQGVKEGVVPPDLDLECGAELFLGLYMGGILHQRLFREEYPLARALPVLEGLMLASVMPAAARGRWRPSPRRARR